MYNREYKEKYLKYLQDSSTYTSKVNGTKKLFRDSEKFEAEKGKDLYDFSVQDLSEFVTGQGDVSHSQVANLICVLKAYVRFADKEGLPDPDIDRNYYTKMFTWKTEIQNVIEWDEVHEFAAGLANPMDAVIVLGLNEGLTRKELIELKKEDIFDGYVRTDERKLEMSDLFIRKAREACDAGFLYPLEFNKKVRRGSSSTRSFIPSDHCLKQTTETLSTNPYILLRLRLVPLRASMPEAADMLDLVKLTESGIVHFLEKRMKEEGFTPEQLFERQNIRDIMSRYHYRSAPRMKEQFLTIIEKRA